MRRPAAIALAVSLGAATLSAGVGIGVGPAGAAGPSVTVAPSINVVRGDRTFVVKGSGFSATANGGLGVYVAFGPKPSLHPSDWFNKIDYYQAAVWVHTGGSGTATNKPMNPDGTFSFTLTNGDGSSIAPAYGSTDCTRIQCGIVTMAAHGSTNRSQDSFRAVIYNTPDPTKAKVTVPYASRVAPVAGLKPYTWVKKSGPLPPGLKLNASNGVISGVPTTEGVYRPVIEVRDSSTPTAAKVSRALVIRVAPKAIVFTPASLPSRPLGAAFSRTIFASGGVAPYTFKVSSGALPPGVKLGANGVLSGTPTQRGTFTFVVRAADKLTFAATKTYSQIIT